jgi:hypothetical protein
MARGFITSRFVAQHAPNLIAKLGRALMTVVFDRVFDGDAQNLVDGINIVPRPTVSRT